MVKGHILQYFNLYVKQADGFVFWQFFPLLGFAQK